MYYAAWQRLYQYGRVFLYFGLSISCAVLSEKESEGLHAIRAGHGFDELIYELNQLENPYGILPADFEHIHFLENGQWLYKEQASWYEFFIFDREYVFLLLDIPSLYFLKIRSHSFYLHLLNEFEQIKKGLLGRKKVMISSPFLKKVGNYQMEIYFSPKEIGFGRSGEAKYRLRQAGNIRPRPDIWRLMSASDNVEAFFPRFEDVQLHRDFVKDLRRGKERRVYTQEVFLPHLRKNLDYIHIGKIFPFPYILGKSLDFSNKHLLDGKHLLFQNRNEITQDFLLFFSLNLGNSHDEEPPLYVDNGLAVLIRGSQDALERLRRNLKLEPKGSFVDSRLNIELNLRPRQLGVPVKTLEPGNLMIIEVLYDVNTVDGSCSEDEDEFIKIYNQTENHVNLAGASIQYSSSSGNFSKKYVFGNYILGPNQEVIIIAQDSGCYNTKSLQGHNLLFKGSRFSFSSHGASFALVTGSKTLPNGQSGPLIDSGDSLVLDYVGTSGNSKIYEGSARVVNCPLRSIVRKANPSFTIEHGLNSPILYLDTNDNANDWECYSGDYSNQLDALVMQTVDRIAKLPILISEIGNKINDSLENDYVVLYNPSNKPLPLANMYIGRDNTCNLSNGWSEFQALPHNREISPYGYFLISRPQNTIGSDWVWQGSITEDYCLVITNSPVPPISSMVELENILDFVHFTRLKQGSAYRRKGPCLSQDSDFFADDFYEVEDPLLPKSSLSTSCPSL